MAGIAKPDNDILIGTKTEMTDYTIGDSYVHGSSSVQGLFDEAAVNEWNTSNVCYLYDSNYYFIITFNKPVNIYRSGTQGWSELYAKLNIYKLNENGDWEDITSSVEQTTSAITHQHWELTIKNLDKGTYKFQATGPRLDSEWFLEETTYNNTEDDNIEDNINPPKPEAIRPSDDILIGSKIEMTNYKILSDKSGNGSNRAKNLFNGTIGGYYGDAFDWNYSGDYINIQINKPCNLYVYLATNAYDQNGPLAIVPETYKEQHELTKRTGWQLYVTGLEAGTYTFANNGYARNDTEWFFEEIESSSDGSTDESEGTGGNTGSDTEEGDNTNGETGSGGSNSGENNGTTEEIIKISKIIKDSVKNTIINNKLIQEHVSIQERDE